MDGSVNSRYFVTLITVQKTKNVMKINCVVVTYNRLQLLKENLKALQEQSLPIHKIFVIDNHSTDGTKEYLLQLQEDSSIHAIILPENIGGAGGFSRGIKEAALDGCDWVWIMDDDSIPAPNALKHLAEATAVGNNVGFVCSKVVWTDGTPHKMNMPVLEYGKGCKRPFNLYSNGDGLLLCRKCSFVSVMINAEAVYRVGLPIAELFIWHDDMEFTERISLAGYTNLYADKSVVLHKTPVNYAPDIITAPVAASWKFYYEARNSLYLHRRDKKSPLLFFFSVLNKYRRYLRQINKREGDKQAFKEVVKRGCKDALGFKPKLEYLSK